MATIKGSDPPLALRYVPSNPVRPARQEAARNLSEYVRRLPVHPVPYARAKRAFDVVLSALLMVCFCWLFLLVAVLVRLTSRGPVIFRQTRVGRGGRLFTCYKFRSMCADAEERKRELMDRNEAAGPVFKIEHDPRLTCVGGFIRKLSLDELPQLYNVFRGDMSMVGPRPPIPQEVLEYGDLEVRRLSVKPGLTCLWQISGRSNITFDHWMELDAAYIDNMSFWLDLKIVAQTVPAVLTGRGAC